MAQRISRAKERIRASGARFELPEPSELDERLRAVLHVLYLIFTEGHASTSGPVHRAGRPQRRGDPPHPAASTRATRRHGGRRPARAHAAHRRASRARTGSTAQLIPLAEQDRGLGYRPHRRRRRADHRRPGHGPLGALPAAGRHQRGARRSARGRRDRLAADPGALRPAGQVDPSPMVPLGRIVGVAMVDGPRAGLEQLAAATVDPALAGSHRVDAVRAHLLELAGDRPEARACYERAARRTLSIPERRYLALQALPAGQRPQQATETTRRPRLPAARRPDGDVAVLPGSPPRPPRRAGRGPRPCAAAGTRPPPGKPTHGCRGWRRARAGEARHRSRTAPRTPRARTAGAHPSRRR